jgi:putative sporulation protein YtaF
MSLHLFSVVLISISSNIDSFAVAVAYGIKKIRITIQANLLIAVVSSLGTFLSMSLGEMISGYLPKSIANILGSGVLIAIGIIGLWQTLEHERERHKRAKYARQNFNRTDVSISPDIEISKNYDYESYIERPPTTIGKRSNTIEAKHSIPLAFSLTINNIGGGVGAGISGLNTNLTTGLTFILAILAISVGSSLGEKFARKMTESWAGLLSSSLIIAIGIYEYFN